jgi:hypothetical protein
MNEWRAAVMLGGVMTREEAEDLARLSESFVTAVTMRPELDKTEVVVTANGPTLEDATREGLRIVAQAISRTGLALDAAGVEVMRWEDFAHRLGADPPMDLVGAVEAAEILNVSGSSAPARGADRLPPTAIRVVGRQALGTATDRGVRPNLGSPHWPAEEARGLIKPRHDALHPTRPYVTDAGQRGTDKTLFIMRCARGR